MKSSYFWATLITVNNVYHQYWSTLNCLWVRVQNKWWNKCILSTRFLKTFLFLNQRFIHTQNSTNFNTIIGHASFIATLTKVKTKKIEILFKIGKSYLFFWKWFFSKWKFFAALFFTARTDFINLLIDLPEFRHYIFIFQRHTYRCRWQSLRTWTVDRPPSSNPSRERLPTNKLGLFGLSGKRYRRFVTIGKVKTENAPQTHATDTTRFRAFTYQQYYIILLCVALLFIINAWRLCVWVCDVRYHSSLAAAAAVISPLNTTEVVCENDTT